MRYFLALALLFAIANPAVAQQRRANNKKVPAKSNETFLRDLTKLIEDAGYTRVRILPQMFVLFAVRSDGKPITLIVDSNSLKAAEVDGAREFIEEGTGVNQGR